MDIDMSKFTTPYIPSETSECERRIQIRYWKRKIEESLQNLKRLKGLNNLEYLIKKERRKEDEFNYYICPFCGDRWLFRLPSGQKVYQPIIFYERKK